MLRLVLRLAAGRGAQIPPCLAASKAKTGLGWAGPPTVCFRAGSSELSELKL